MIKQLIIFVTIIACVQVCYAQWGRFRFFPTPQKATVGQWYQFKGDLNKFVPTDTQLTIEAKKRRGIVYIRFLKDAGEKN